MYVRGALEGDAVSGRGSSRLSEILSHFVLLLSEEVKGMSDVTVSVAAPEEPFPIFLIPCL